MKKIHPLRIGLLSLFFFTTAGAQTIVSRSIGTNSATIYSTGNASITSGTSTVTFAGGASLPTNIGEGDSLVISSTVFFILSRDNATQVTVQTAAASTLTAQTYRIKRAFTTLQGWEDVCPSDLVASNQVYKGVCYNDGAFTGNILINGMTTDATRYVWLTVAPGQRHNGKPGTGAVMDRASSTLYCLQIGQYSGTAYYTLVEWLEIKNHAGSGDQRGAVSFVTRYCTARNILVYNTTTQQGMGVHAHSGNTGEYCKMYNCVFYNMTTGIYNYNANSGVKNSYYNNTVFKCATGFDNQNAYADYKNNISVGNTTNWANLSSATGGNNAGETGNNPPGSNDLLISALNTVFTDTTNATLNLHEKAGSSTINAGDSTGLLAVFTKDIDDTGRLAQFDIGADEWIHPKTWTGGGADNNWNTAGNWYGGAAPGASDTAFFSGVGTKNATINVNISINRLQLDAGYTGTLTQAAGITVTLGAGGYFQTGSTFTGSDAGFSTSGLFSLSGGTFNAGSQTITTTHNLNPGTNWSYTGGTFNAQTSTVAFTATNHTTVSSGAMSFNNVSINLCSSCSFVASGTMDINGNFTQTQATSITGTLTVAGNVTTTDATLNGTGVVKFDGTGSQTLGASGGTGMLPGVEINKASGTLTIQDNINVGGSASTTGWVYTAGTVTSGTSTVIFMAQDHYAINMGSGAMSFNNVTFNTCGSCGLVLTGTMDVNGNLGLTVAAGMTGGTITVAGNLTSSDASVTGTTNITLDGTGTQTISVGANDIPDGTFTINKAFGSAVLAGNLTLGTGQALTITAGTLSQGASYNLQCGALTVGASGALVNIGTGDLTLGGNVSNSGTIYFNGSGHLAGDADGILIRSSAPSTTRTWSGAGRYLMYDVDVQRQDGTVTAYSSTSSGNTNWTYATVFTNRYSIGTSAAVLYSTGTATTNSTRDTITFSGSLPANVGEGDRLVLDVNASVSGPDTVYILSRVSTTKAALQLPAAGIYTGEDFEIKRRFNTLATWESGRQGILTTQNVMEKGVCYNDGSFSSGVTIAGSTTDATRYLWLTAAYGQRHAGIAGSGVRIDGGGTAGMLIDIQNNYSVVEWLEVYNFTDKGIRIQVATDVTLRNCLIHNPSSAGAVAGGIWYDERNGAIANEKVYNNILYNLTRGIYVRDSLDAGDNNKFYNNTAYRCSTGIKLYRGTAVNNISVGNWSANFSLPASPSNYPVGNNNASEAAVGFGTANITTTPGVEFLDTTTAAPDLHLKGGAASYNAGVSLAGSFTNDIDDSTRPFAGTWDIGADEYFDLTPPANVTGLSTGTITTNSVQLNWTASASSDAAKVYILYRTDGTYPTAYNDGSATVADSVNHPTPATYTVNNLPDNATLRFGLFVRDAVPNWSASSAGAQVTAATPDGAPNNPLILARTDSATTSYTFHHNGGGSLSGDVSTVYFWVSATRSLIDTTLAETFTRTKAQLGVDYLHSGLANATMYYIGVCPKDAGGLWSPTLKIDSFYTKINNPLTLTLSPDNNNGLVFADYANPSSLSANVDSVLIYYRTGSYQLTNTAAFDTAFTRAGFLSLPLQGASRRLTIPDITTGTWFVSSTLVLREGSFSMRSAMPGGAADTSRITVNFDFPLNPYTLSPFDRDTQLVKLNIGKYDTVCAPCDVESVYVYVNTDSTVLANSYKTTAGFDTLSLAEVLGGPTLTVSGLTHGTKYYLGIATRNSAKNFSTSISIVSHYTRMKNPLRIALSERSPEVGDSALIVDLSGVSSLHSSANQIRLFYSPGTYQGQLDFTPASLTFNRPSADTQLTIPSFNGQTKYYFTVNSSASSFPSYSQYSYIDTRDLPTGNGDTLTTGDYSSPVNNVTIQIDSVRPTRVYFQILGSPPAITDSVYIFVRPDPVTNISNSWRTQSPWQRVIKTAMTGPWFVDTLQSGGVYWLGAALKSTYKIWSDTVKLANFTTSVQNPVTLTLQRLGNDTVVVNFGNTGSVPGSATTMKLFYKDTGYVTDGSFAAELSYARPFPTKDTIVFPASTEKRYYFSVSPGYTGNWGGVTSQNEASINVDNVAPSNLLFISFTDSTTSSVTLNIGNGATLPADVESVYVYADVSFAALTNNYLNPAYAKRVVHKSNLLNLQLTGLLEATHYYVGIAPRDTIGNFSTTLVTKVKFTALANPVTVSAAESGTSGILNITFGNVASLNAKVDTVRLYFKTGNGVFDPRSYDGAQLKASYLKADLLSNPTVSISNFLGNTTYFFAVNAKYLDSLNHYSDIAVSNRDTITTGDYAEPANITLSILDSTNTTLDFSLNGAATLEADVAEVFLYYSTNRTTIDSFYETIPSWDTLTRAQAIASTGFEIPGLSEGVKYYVGIAVRDTAGNWCTSANVDSSFTKINNPLTLSLAINPANNRQVQVTVNNVGSLPAILDTLRLYYKIGSANTDPYAAPDLVIYRPTLTNPLTITFPDALEERYFFSVAPGFYAGVNGHQFGAISAPNTGNIFVDSKEPPVPVPPTVPPLTVSITDSTLTTLTTFPDGWQDSLYGIDVKRLYIWVNTDSNILRLTFKTLPPVTTVTLDSLLFQGAHPVLTGLDTGTTYWVGVAPRDTNGNFSNSISIAPRHKTDFPPVNPLRLSGTAIYYNTVRLYVDSINVLTPDADRTKARILYSSTGYVTDPYDTTNYRSLNIDTSPKDTITISGLTKETQYYFSITLPDERGYYAKIATPLNTVTLTTPVAADTVAPNLTGLVFRVDSGLAFVTNPATQLFASVDSLQTVTGRDRDSLVLRLYWSDQGYYRDFINPAPPNVGSIELGPQIVGNSTFWIAGGLLPGSVAPGRRYYFTLCGRDSSNNWDTTHIKQATRHTVVDKTRPANYPAWNVRDTAFTRLRINWPVGFFNNSPGLFDTVTSVGVWVSQTPITQATVDAGAPDFSINPLSPPALIDTVIFNHNSLYYVAVSPLSKVGNWGAVTLNQSYFALQTPFDSATIPTPPNLCSLWVTPTLYAESLTVRLKLSGATYPDPVNNINVKIDSVAVYYKIGSQPPSFAGDGVLLFRDSVTGPKTIVGTFDNFPPGTLLSFGAFNVNEIPLNPAITYTNRWSPPNTNAQASITTGTTPVNKVAFDSLWSTGTSLANNKIYFRWHWDTTFAAGSVKFMSKLFNDVSDIPVSFSDPRFDTLPYRTLDTLVKVDSLMDSLQSNKPYIVAAFVRIGGIWSTTPVWDTLHTPYGADTVAPPVIDSLKLTVTRLNSKSVQLSWVIDTAYLNPVNRSENGTLRFGYDFSLVGTQVFTDSTRPYNFTTFVPAAESGSIVLTDLTPNSDYYFGIAPMDTVFNAAVAGPAGVGLVQTTVPPFDTGGVVSAALLTNQILSLDWHLGMAADSTTYAADPAVRFVSVVVTNDTTYFAGALPISDRFDTTAGVIFLCSTYTVDNLRRTLGALDFSTDTFYVSAYASVDANHFGSTPLKVGRFHYHLDNPSLANLRMSQVNDSLVRVTFSPRDSTEPRVHLWTTFGVNKPTAGTAMTKSDVDTHFTYLPDDTLAVGALCTAYVRLNATGISPTGFRGTDTNELYLKYLLNDMMPVSEVFDDAAYFTYLTVDRKAPVNSLVRISYTRLGQVFACSVRCDLVGHLRTILWGPHKDSLTHTVAYPDSMRTKWVFIRDTGHTAIFIRLLDTLGNAYDTSFKDFDFTRFGMSVTKDTVYSVDNGGVSVAFGPTDFDPIKGRLNTEFLHVGLWGMPTANRTRLTQMGYPEILPNQYWFMMELYNLGIPKELSSQNGGFDLTISFDSALYDSALRVYRYYPSDGWMEYVGGTPDASGRMTLTHFKPDLNFGYWSSMDNPAGGNSADSFYFVIAKDIRKPVVDTLRTQVALRGDSVTVIYRVVDNTVNLDAQLRLFTFGNVGPLFSEKPLFDTLTESLQSRTGRDTSVLCTLIVPVTGTQNRVDVRTRGVFFALRVSDGKETFYFMSPAQNYDSLTGVFSSVSSGWKLVTVTGNLQNGPDIISNLPSFGNTYDRTRLRLFGVEGNAHVEYSSANTLFKVGQSSAYLIRTHLTDDKDVRFKTKDATSWGLKSGRGYKGAAGTGWHLVSLPFLGTVSKAAIVTASVWSRNDSTRLPMDSLIYTLDGTSYQKATANQVFKSLGGYGEAFLVYLYFGDTLYIPVTGDLAFLPKRKLNKMKSSPTDWRSSLVLTGRGERVDAFNTVGVTASGSYQIPKLQSLTGEGITLNEGWGMDLRRNDAPGHLWRVRVAPQREAKDYGLTLSNLSAIPEKQWVYLDDPMGKVSFDLRALKGEYPFDLTPKERREFKLVVGDSAYVMRNVSRQAPQTFDLSRNFPNPFNPSTRIDYRIPAIQGSPSLSKTRLTLDLYDIRGRRLARLKEGPARPGYYTVRFNGCDDLGKPLASGLYLYELSVRLPGGATKFQLTKKMMMVK